MYRALILCAPGWIYVVEGCLVGQLWFGNCRRCLIVVRGRHWLPTTLPIWCWTFTPLRRCLSHTFVSCQSHLYHTTSTSRWWQLLFARFRWPESRLPPTNLAVCWWVGCLRPTTAPCSMFVSCWPTWRSVPTITRWTWQIWPRYLRSVFCARTLKEIQDSCWQRHQTGQLPHKYVTDRRSVISFLVYYSCQHSHE